MQSGFDFLRPRARVDYSLECLEPRRLLSASVTQPIAPITLQEGASTTIDLTRNFGDTTLSGTVVEFDTNGGNIIVQLSDAATPLTVANFLSYVNQGLYNGTIIHRSLSNFVVQGGGFTPDGNHIPTAAPVMNEFGQSNVAGTIAMAKLGSDPNSATSEWFFNVGDNSQNLDHQNGGFTVFGKILNGLGVVRQINQLQTVSTTLGASSFTNLPVFNLAAGAMPTAANLITVSKVFVAPKDNFTATSDVPGLVNPLVDSAGTMTLNVSPNASGYAHITVRADGINGGASVTDVFRVHVTAGTSRTMNVNLGGTAPGTINFHLGSRDDGRVSLNGPGTAVLEFTGDNLNLSGGNVTGDNLQLDSITASGTTTASSLTVLGTNFKSSFVPVGDISTTGSLNTITIARGLMQGDLTVGGSLQFARIPQARDGTIRVGGTSSGGTLLNVLNVSFANENLVSAEPVALIKALSWSNLDSVSEVAQAPSIRRIDALRNFAPGVQVTAGGTTGLGSMIVRGAIGGTWSIPGRLPALKVNGTESDFNATFSQPLGALRFTLGFAGSLTVPSIASLFVHGNLQNASLTLTAPFDARKQDLGSLMVTGLIIDSSIVSAGNIGPIATLSLVQSKIFAGVAALPSGQLLPASASDFASAATIASLTTRSSAKEPGFVESFVAAQTLGPLDLNQIESSDGGVPLGFAAHFIRSLTGADLLGTQTFALHNLDSPATLLAQVTAQKLNLHDMTINLV